MSLLPSVIDHNDRFIQEPPEWPKDVLLNYDVEDDEEHWYRFRRETKDYPKKIVYIRLTDPDLLPRKPSDKILGPWVISELRKMAWRCWGHWWHTLTISRGESGEVVCKKDDFKPDYIPQELLIPNLPRFRQEFLQYEEQDKYASQSIRITPFYAHQLLRPYDLAEFPWGNDGQELMFTGEPPPFYPRESDNYLVLKSEPFPNAAPYIAQEAKVYKALTERECYFAPRLVGYICEGSQDQVNGLILETLEGVPPTIDRFFECDAALKRLHGYGVVHNQILKEHIIMTHQGPKFMDFSEAMLDLDVLPDAESPFGPEVKELRRRLLGDDVTELTKDDLEEMRRKEIESLDQVFADIYDRQERS